MAEKRKAARKPVFVTTIIRKSGPAGATAGDYEIMEFRTQDMSNGGIFISTENLGIFDLGDEVEILVDDDGKRYYEGKARVVRSARVFTGEGNPIESGFGLMFLSPDTEFMGMITRKIKD